MKLQSNRLGETRASNGYLMTKKDSKVRNAVIINRKMLEDFDKKSEKIKASDFRETLLTVNRFPVNT
jgi:hypothetical protein